MLSNGGFIYGGVFIGPKNQPILRLYCITTTQKSYADSKQQQQPEENGGLLATNNLAVPKELYTRRSLDENSGKNQQR